MEFHADAVENTRCNLIASRAMSESDEKARCRGVEEGLVAGSAEAARYYLDRIASAQRFGWRIEIEHRARDGIAFLIPNKEG